TSTDLLASDAPSVDVAAHLSGERGLPSIEFSLTNTGSSSLDMYKSDLPWGIRSSTLLIAVQLNAERSSVPEALYIDDPGPTTVTLRPGQTFTGQINLVDRFPQFLKALTETDVVVFWTYVPTRIDGTDGARFGGFIHIPRQ